MEMARLRDVTAVDRIIAIAEEANPRCDGDYINPDDGLLYCGKCHTPKQFRMPEEHRLQFRQEVVPIPCSCAKTADEETKRMRDKSEAMEAVRLLKRNSLMDEKFRSQTFASFEITDNNARAHNICRRYADRFGEMLSNNQGLLFWGDVGTGKTFAAACIANALLERQIPVVMTSFVKLLENPFADDEDKLIARLNKAQLLVIDDLGAERNSDFALEKVYNIIDSRYRARLPMIITTNLSTSEMWRATDSRFARIYERIFEVCYPVKFAGTSFRAFEAQRRADRMKKLLEETENELI